MTKTVPTPTDITELTGYAATAAELRHIADALDTLPSSDEPLSGQLYMFPSKSADAVDAILFAINRARGETRLASDGWVRSGWIALNSLTIHVRVKVPAPPDERDVELERLRAENAALRAAEDPDHGRTTAVGEAKPDTLMVPHGEAHRTSNVQHLGGYTTYFSFGHGQTDPDTGESLIDKYVTVIAPTYEACREAMFASRYGERWSFDYPAGTPTAAEWIPQWTEHERIVVDPAAASVPAMQTRPQCSPHCLEAYAIKQIAATQHLDGCPNGKR